ncbi:BON domain protein [Symmachiella macrocystis]|uniref:BON domain protein n=2 Tax=Symmachiella macrocystis TaxID=2527985 RepID=A0A5C6B6Z4_9PLAN|nr:BON domain protein [Symmachiella macrocystis]
MSILRSGGGLLCAAVLFLAGNCEVLAQAQSLYNKQGPVRGQTNTLLPQTSSGATGGAGSGSTAYGAQTAAAYSGTSVLQRGNFAGLEDSQSFVGVDPNASQANGNARNRNTTRNRNTNRGNANRGNANRGLGGNQNYQRGNQGSNNRRRAIRPQQRVNFAFPERPKTEVVTALRSQFAAHAERYPTLANITVLEEDGRIELFGEVDSPEKSRLAAMIVRMEPGVKQVVNHLTVQSPPGPMLE